MLRVMSRARPRSSIAYAFRLTLASIALASAAGCGTSLGEDFDSFCKVVNETNGDKTLNSEAKLAKIAGRSAEYMKSPESAAADNVWQKLNNTAVDKKYAFLVDSAKAAGKSDWHCTGYEKIMVTLSVEQAAKQKAAEEREKAAQVEAKPDAGVPPDAGTAADKKAAKKAAKKAKKKRRH